MHDCQACKIPGNIDEDARIRLLHNEKVKFVSDERAEGNVLHSANCL